MLANKFVTSTHGTQETNKNVPSPLQKARDLKDSRNTNSPERKNSF